MMGESGILSGVNRQTTGTYEQLKKSMESGGRDMMSMADAAEAARRDKIVGFLCFHIICSKILSNVIHSRKSTVQHFTVRLTWAKFFCML